ncbi:MAG: TIGR03960 family B12-binding radical SAM protein [Deltaproteobacteria bacterium]|nr:TIGR03960 family B12-binding radical SAM protein [Deltaproteobacteria bacterium]
MIDLKINSDILSTIRKPARYIGGELNAVVKDPEKARLRVALAFPDVYEVGMSHLGLKILYNILNSNEDIFAERVFAPWPDMEQQMRKRGIPLGTLETGCEVRKMDIVGFSLQYELCATTVLQILDLAGIPLRSSERSNNDPLVLAGGPVCFNPMPMSDFFDAFLIGDGEEAIVEICNTVKSWKHHGGERLDLLSELKKIRGVFVPTLHDIGETVNKRIVSDLDKVGFPHSFVVPFCDITHDRVGIEIARGCTRGCRFCQAGIIYRPVRERKVEELLSLSKDLLKSTGWNEIGLLSLSSGDYSSISYLVKRLTHDFSDGKVAISLPSLRTDTFDSDLAAEIKKVRKTGFTLAPEAGTERLRRVINKGNSEEDLKSAIISAFRLGWKAVKLYFMIGLPTETEADLEGIADLIFKASRWGRAGQIRASISTFVPKSHTPFQWVGQISLEETFSRQKFIRSMIRKKSTSLKFHNPKISFLEGIFARGDRELGLVIETAFKKGARLDGWDELLNFQLWMDSFEESGLNPNRYLEQRSFTEPLPWDPIQSGVKKSYLLDEFTRAMQSELTVDCRLGSCSGCGVCDFREVAPVIHEISVQKVPNQPEVDGEFKPQTKVRRFRLRYSKSGMMKFLGHHDIMRCFERAFRRADLEPDYSHGFHPHPKLRFSLPTALGIESFVEYLDFDLRNCGMEIGDIFETLENALPNGLKPLEIYETSLNEADLSAKIRTVVYETLLDIDFNENDIRNKLTQFLEKESLIISFGPESNRKVRDLKQYVSSISLSGQTITLKIKMTQSGSVNPFEAIGAVLCISQEQARSLKITKKEIEFDSGSILGEGNQYG